MPHALIALGSNLGDRAAALDQATAALARLPRTHLVARSRWHETDPIGGPAGQGPFLNGAVRIATTLSPQALHRENQQIEVAANRTRGEHWAARTLDVDLLLYGDAAMDTDQLKIPHPRMSFRRFVLEAAQEVAGDMRVPGLEWTVGQLWRRLNRGPEQAAFVGNDSERVAELARRLAQRFGCPVLTRDAIAEIDRPAPTIAILHQRDDQLKRAKLTVYFGAEVARGKEIANPDGLVTASSGKLARARPGPTLLLGPITVDEAYREAAAAMQSVWPALR